MQLRWLGWMLLAAGLPLVAHVPIWVAVMSAALVVVRLAFLQRDRMRPDAAAARIPSWALPVFALASAWMIYASYGYLVGRDPPIAFMLVLVGIKFLEARTLRDGTLLVCLAAFLSVTPFLFTQSPVSALAALPVLFAIGGSLAALHARTPLSFAATEPRAALKMMGRLMLQGLPLAAMLFVLFPRLGAPLWGVPQSGRAITGLSDTMAPGRIAELIVDDSVAFRADFEGRPPPSAKRYWRGPVMSRFDGVNWGASYQARSVPQSPPSPTSIRYTVALEPYAGPWLFALETAQGIPETGDSMAAGEIGMTRDRQLIARRPIGQMLRYTQSSVLDQAAPAHADEVVENLRLPLASNPRTREYAQTLRSRTASDRAFIDALLRQFREENFVYTLEPGLLPARDPVDAFLFDVRRGFCEHYASAFTVLLRAAGIPARVVTGYQGGELNPRGNYLVIRQSDAHAWTEAIVDGAWQRFDPTGAVSPLRIESGLSRALPDADLALFSRLNEGLLKDVHLFFDAMSHAWRRHLIGFDRGRQHELLRTFNLDPSKPWQSASVAAFAVAIWMLVLLAWLSHRRTSRERVAALWSDVCATLARAGLPRAPHEGPLEFSSRASRRWPDYAIAFRAIGESYARLKYGRVKPREREALIETLTRAAEVLPNTAALRGSR